MVLSKVQILKVTGLIKDVSRGFGCSVYISKWGEVAVRGGGRDNDWGWEKKRKKTQLKMIFLLKFKENKFEKFSL